MARQNKNAPTQPAPNRKALWLIGVAVLVIAVVGIYFATRGANEAPAPSTETGTSADVAPLPTSRHIYSETADPQADISAALKQARAENKRVILDFGGDWCGDCQVLDIYFHQPPNAQILADKFVLVHVWIGHMDQHLDIPEKYGIPLNKGVPALAVLGPDGKVLYAQRSGEFEKMRQMNPGSVTEFLNAWKS